MDLPGPVRGQDHDRRDGGADGAELRDRHLEVGQELEEEPLELVVRPIDLVDQQDRPASIGLLQRLQQRAFDQEGLAEELLRRARAIERVAGLEETDLQELSRVVPLVERLRDVDALVTLKANQLGAERPCERLGDLRLADARFAFHKQRPAELQREPGRNRQAAIGDVLLAGEELCELVDRVRERFGQMHAITTRFARPPASARVRRKPAPSLCGTRPTRRCPP